MTIEQQIECLVVPDERTGMRQVIAELVLMDAPLKVAVVRLLRKVIELEDELVRVKR